MSFEDLEKARANRAAKEQAKVKGNGRRGRKAKNATPEELETATGNRSGRKRKAPEPGVTKAKVARVCECPELASA